MFKGISRGIMVFAIILSGYPVVSQQILYQPLKWQKPRWSGTIDTLSNTVQSWVVFSDRDNNPSYEQPKSKTVIKKLNFLDQFYVTATDGSYLHIYKDVIDAQRYNKLSPSNEDMGWIKIDQLLPNQFCYINDEAVNMKAILLNTTNVVSGNINKLKSLDFHKVRFYKDPDLLHSTGTECNLYQIYYIYKRYPSFPPYKSLLLGKNPKFGIYNKEDIIGWVDFNRLIIWNHRVAVSPNTLPDAMKERKQKHINATIFTTIESASQFGQGQSGNKMDEIWQDDSFYPGEALSPWFPRFPVLWNNKEIDNHNGVMKIGIIGDVVSEVSNSVIRKSEMAIVQKEYNEKRNLSRQINILFIIDGTRSMQPYLESVKAAISKSMKGLEGNTRNNFRFAAAIYRDVGDGDDLLFASTSLTGNYDEVASWLSRQKALSTRDPDVPEAVNYGITEALRRISLPVNGETNYVILIGDAGNHSYRPNDKTNVSQKEVIDMLFDYNCFFTAFQVFTSPDPSYMVFLKSSKEILESLSFKYYERNLKKMSGTGLLFQPLGKLFSDQERKWSLTNPPFPGFVMQGKINSFIAPEVLTQNLVGTIQKLDAVVTEGVKAMQELVETGDFKDKEISNIQLGYLKRLNLSQDILHLLSEKHVQLYYEGYCSATSKKLSEPVWQNEILFSTDEMYNMLKVLDRLDDERKSESELRDNFIDAWKVTLARTLGHNTLGDLENLRLEDAERMVFGGVGTTKLLEYKLRDFRDRSKVSPADLRIFLLEIAKKRRFLNSIYTGISKESQNYSWISNDFKYYWIPQRLLP